MMLTRIFVFATILVLCCSKKTSVDDTVRACYKTCTAEEPKQRFDCRKKCFADMEKQYEKEMLEDSRSAFEVQKCSSECHLHGTTDTGLTGACTGGEKISLNNI